jgi:hypothetical protein
MYVLPAGMTIVLPAPQDLKAASIAGTSSVFALPAEMGVHVARLFTLSMLREKSELDRTVAAIATLESTLTKKTALSIVYVWSWKSNRWPSSIFIHFEECNVQSRYPTLWDRCRFTTGGND